MPYWLPHIMPAQKEYAKGTVVWCSFDVCVCASRTSNIRETYAKQPLLLTAFVCATYVHRMYVRTRTLKIRQTYNHFYPLLGIIIILSHHIYFVLNLLWLVANNRPHGMKALYYTFTWTSLSRSIFSQVWKQVKTIHPVRTKWSSGSFFIRESSFHGVYDVANEDCCFIFNICLVIKLTPANTRGCLHLNWKLKSKI